MTIPLTPSSLTRLGALVAQRWPACAEAQGLRRCGLANVGSEGHVYITLGYLPPSDFLHAFDRAAESLSRILKDEGYDVERGDRDGRPTWRVVGEATVGDGVPVRNLSPWCGDRRARDERLAADRLRRDAPRHAAASDPRGPKYGHAVRVGEMAEMSRRGPKDSKYLRIRLDVVFEWPEPGCLQMAGQKDYSDIIGAIAKVAQSRGAVGLGPSSISFGVDNRKRDSEGRLVK